jgi:outer membrane protein OmpA-like peptidoglycan-associated protein/tetratricopeptide (TPR) repeat protein
MRYLLILLLCLPFCAFAQRQYSSSNKEAIKFYVLANESINYQQYDQAAIQLKQAIAADDQFAEAHNQLGNVYRYKHQYADAFAEFTRTIALNPNYNHAVYLNLGDVAIALGKYAEAKTALNQYTSFKEILAKDRAMAEKLIADCDFSVQAMQHPVVFKPENLGTSINTNADEYLPNVTADESTLIFTRKIGNNEDFYQSKKLTGKWATSIGLSNKINTPEYNEGAQSLTQDGQYLFFTGCNRPDGKGRCDIFLSHKNSTDWDKPFNLGGPINTPGWESQPSISADGRTLYFVSLRKGGYGGYDIWKSTLQDKGWSEPENLGPNINTPYDEQSPFIHPDDQTLYFSSNGWPGFGSKDLFLSRKGSDGKWQKPENLGYPINSGGDENGLTLTANGSYAFFSSNNLKGSGGYDIYTFELPEKLRPNVVTYVKGMVKDAKTKTAIDADVQIIDLKTNQLIFQNVNALDQGQFLATLPTGKDYGLNISRPGYLFYSENFSLSGQKTEKPFLIEVALQAIEAGRKSVLRNIFFDTNKFVLKPESKSELEKLIAFLNLNPKVTIEISGFTDNVGDAKLNQLLSENRAKAVYNYLISNKVASSKLTFKGYGAMQPIAANTTEEGRSRNRRTEFKIVSN